jgi:hypothetical protein
MAWCHGFYCNQLDHLPLMLEYFVLISVPCDLCMLVFLQSKSQNGIPLCCTFFFKFGGQLLYKDVMYVVRLKNKNNAIPL